MLYRSLLVVGCASVAAFQATPARSAVLQQPRCASPAAIELPSLPSLPGLPSLELPASISDIIAYKPKEWKSNENKFDKDGRLVSGPKVVKGQGARPQVTKDNTKTKN